MHALISCNESGCSAGSAPCHRAAQEGMGASECDLVYNKKTADALGVDVTLLVDEGGTDVSA